jgi:hypothetical protein
MRRIRSEDLQKTRYLPAVGEEVRVDDADGSHHRAVRRWEALAPDLRERVVKILPKIQEVHPYTEEQWVNGFLFDQHPEREAAIWEDIAERYTRLSVGKSPRNKQRIWQSIMAGQRFAVINPLRETEYSDCQSG